MAKVRLTRAQVVKMKRSIVENVNLILESEDKLSKDKMIRVECEKYDWYEDVVNYLGVKAILDYDCNIFDLKKAVYYKKLEEGVRRLDTSYNESISKLRVYLIEEEIITYGSFYKLSTCSTILKEACELLNLPPLTSSAYFSVLFDVMQTSVKVPEKAGGYRVLGKYTGNGFKINNPIMKGN